VNRRDPLLPKPVLVFLAVVVALGWLATVYAALRDPANSGPLLVVTGLLATVIGASFGIQVGVGRSRAKNDRTPPEDEAE
jgi:nitrate/nitrite transporter NarK